MLGEAPAGERVRVDVSERSGPLVLGTHGFGAIRVSVVGAENVGRPYAVFARGVTPEPAQALRGEGGEHLLEQLPLGTYEVYLEPGGTRAARAEARLEQHGESVAVVLQYPELLAIAGRVLDSGGAPVVDAHVRARPAPGDDDDDEASFFSADVEAWSDAQGEFVLEGLARGAYELCVSSGAGNGVLRPVSAGAKR